MVKRAWLWDAGKGAMRRGSHAGKRYPSSEDTLAPLYTSTLTVSSPARANSVPDGRTIADAPPETARHTRGVHNE